MLWVIIQWRSPPSKKHNPSYRTLNISLSRNIVFFLKSSEKFQLQKYGQEACFLQIRKSSMNFLAMKSFVTYIEVALLFLNWSNKVLVFKQWMSWLWNPESFFSFEFKSTTMFQLVLYLSCFHTIVKSLHHSPMSTKLDKCTKNTSRNHSCYGTVP